MASSPTIEFWYDFASTYSYLSAMRIEAMAAEQGIGVHWRPFLLGPIFAAQGWRTSPFNIYATKGRYMVRDMERLCAERGLTFALPAPFPQHSVLAARVASVGVTEGWLAPFSRTLFEAEFAKGADISNEVTICHALRNIGLDANRIVAEAQQPAVKEALRARVAEAQAKGIFGAPTFVVGKELFWGDDRLGQALQWAATT